MTVYEMINKIILDKLEEGVVPWKKLWKSSSGLPAISLSTGRKYNGVNQILLSCVASVYNSPYFMTYKQARERGGHIKSGEKGYPIVFFKCIEKKDNSEDEPNKKRFILRFYKVFNYDQCENVKLSKKEIELLKSVEVEQFNYDPNEKAEDFVAGLTGMPEIKYAPFFNPSYNRVFDEVHMPPMNQFSILDEYYTSLFHELIHSTGHKSRLDRKLDRTEKKDKVMEELVAEIGAMYMTSHVGLEQDTFDNSAAYIGEWIKEIGNNKRLFMTAASRAEKAFNFISDSYHKDEAESIISA